MRREEIRFERRDVEPRRVGAAVQVEIHYRAGGVFDRRKPLVEITRGEQPLQQRLGQRLAGAVMPGVAPQRFRHRQPVLEDLRGKFDKVAAHRGARLRWIAHPRQQPVQPVAELVEEGPRVVEAQQGRVALRKIVVVDDDRQHLVVEVLLLAVAAHPGAGALAGPREIVVQKEPDRPAGVVPHLIGADIGVIGRAVRALDKAEAEEPPRRVEEGLDDVVEHEIRLHRGFIERVFLLPHLFRVIAPVPRRDRLVEPIGQRRRGEVGALLGRAPFGRLPHLLAGAPRRPPGFSPSCRRAGRPHSCRSRAAAPARRAAP